jgi:hypothetical protein
MIGVDQDRRARLCQPYLSKLHHEHERDSKETTVHEDPLIRRKNKAMNGLYPPTARGGFSGKCLRRFVPVTLVNTEVEVWDDWHPSAQHLREF